MFVKLSFSTVYVRGAGSVMKLVEPTDRGRGWHVSHRTGYRSRAMHGFGDKVPRSEIFNELRMLG